MGKPYRSRPWLGYLPPAPARGAPLPGRRQALVEAEQLARVVLSLDQLQARQVGAVVRLGPVLERGVGVVRVAAAGADGVRDRPGAVHPLRRRRASLVAGP